MTEPSEDNPWVSDVLQYGKLGSTFTNLIKSIDGAKVISIEAGFGWGKTFFRRAWAEHLRQEDEVVIEIDAQQSDHSGDPVVTFLGALMLALPDNQQSAFLKAWSSGKKLAWGGMKIGASVVARKAGEEFVDALSDKLSADGEMSKLDEILTAFGENVSRALSAQVAAQLAAEDVRSREMPEQLAELRSSLTKDHDTDRVVILIDELDRCHPDYAIALLEAMKIAFNEEGFVFVLFVNAEYLENLAKHRFGEFAGESGEGYLDKFIDLRLKLAPSVKAKADAARQIVLQLPDYEPYGDHAEFSKERAGQVAFDAITRCNPSMRQIKRTLERVELVIRCYPNEPMDLPLLLCIAFHEVGRDHFSRNDVLSRSSLTPERGRELVQRIDDPKREWDPKRERRVRAELEEIVRTEYPELLQLPEERFELPDEEPYYPYWRVINFLAPRYLLSHDAMLSAVHQIQMDP
ncbi:P-loop NTPase fold protein [Roseovarius atlanticus]|uniref:KAP family P-loop NTPase fold protein n=1 Tax=Roseovarius atlanticus TaxID=1641875 RepID=UPI001C97067E|nr:P-loop NTPase fold protein [Roseovarius atlanticus]MBY5986356.1 KAP family NTPase [Roseovarius atlanticus]MBY6124996.1 KAP family NTPase [Roseovarius atlanticus]MBY6150543.1 KAP family NTPase [Roseovarius atlanticus]